MKTTQGLRGNGLEVSIKEGPWRGAPRMISIGWLKRSPVSSKWRRREPTILRKGETRIRDVGRIVRSTKELGP